MMICVHKIVVNYTSETEIALQNELLTHILEKYSQCEPFGKRQMARWQGGAHSFPKHFKFL